MAHLWCLGPAPAVMASKPRLNPQKTEQTGVSMCFAQPSSGYMMPAFCFPSPFYRFSLVFGFVRFDQTPGVSFHHRWCATSSCTSSPPPVAPPAARRWSLPRRRRCLVAGALCHGPGGRSEILRWYFMSYGVYYGLLSIVMYSLNNWCWDFCSFCSVHWQDALIILQYCGVAVQEERRAMQIALRSGPVKVGVAFYSPWNQPLGTPPAMHQGKLMKIVCLTRGYSLALI